MKHQARCGRRVCLRVAALALAALSAWPAATVAAALSPQPPSGRDSAGTARPPTADHLKLLFSDPQDITDTYGTLLPGLPEDRIRYVSARANGEFSTKSFPMPAADLFLNAASPAPRRPLAEGESYFGAGQAYVPVVVLDDKDQTVPGFEAEKCLIRNEDRPAIPLKWGEASVRQRAGRTVRLRFFFRSASIYAVTFNE